MRYVGWYLGVVVFLWVAQCSVPAQGTEIAIVNDLCCRWKRECSGNNTRGGVRLCRRGYEAIGAGLVEAFFKRGCLEDPISDTRVVCCICALGLRPIHVHVYGWRCCWLLMKFGVHGIKRTADRYEPFGGNLRCSRNAFCLAIDVPRRSVNLRSMTNKTKDFAALARFQGAIFWIKRI